MHHVRFRAVLSLTLCAAALVALFGAGAVQAWFRSDHGSLHCTAKQARLDHNKQTVSAFYTTAFNDGKPAEAVERYIGVDADGNKTYTQHNPQAVDGPQGFIDFVTGFKASFPEAHVDIVRIIAEGDLVITHSHLTTSPSDRGSVAADIFRLDAAGYVVEHWDVLQQIPDTAVNDNGMF